MSRPAALVRGELDRLNKYNLFAALVVTALVWVALAWFLSGDELRLFVPFVFLVDSVLMSILLVGATLFYEKQEHTVDSILVTPVTEDQYLLAKVIVSVLNSLFTVVFVSAALFFMKGVVLNYLLLVPAVTVVTAVHSLIGIRLAYQAKSFSSLLVNLVAYAFLFLTPSLFALVGIIPAAEADYLIVLPPEAARVLIGAAASAGPMQAWRLVLGFAYLGALALVLYPWVVKPAFHDYVIRETGV